MVTALTVIPDFFSQIYAYREYLKQSVLRDLRIKYKRSVLGYVWTMLHPLAMMSVLAVVFSHIMRIGIKDYAIFLFCGLIPWNYFQSTALMSLHSIRANARLFSQVAVPKYIFILSIAVSNLVNLLFALVPLILIMLVLGHPLPLSALAFPLVILPFVFTVLAVSLVVAAANVFFDDTLHLTEVALNMLYFMSPVLYGRENLPQDLISILKLSPVFSQIEFMRGVFYYGQLPDPAAFGINLVVSLLLLMAALLFFRRVEDRFLYFI